MTEKLIETVQKFLDIEEIHPSMYEFERFSDDDNVEMLHTRLGLLYKDLTSMMRENGIYVDATAESQEDRYQLLLFLREEVAD